MSEHKTIKYDLTKLTEKNECFFCASRRSIPGDTHSMCITPYSKMKGNPHGVNHGWFFYPFNFDPIWKEELCPNFRPAKPPEGYTFATGTIQPNDYAWDFNGRRWIEMSGPFESVIGHKIPSKVVQFIRRA